MTQYGKVLVKLTPTQFTPYKVILKSHFPSFTLLFRKIFFFSFDEYTTKRTLAD